MDNIATHAYAVCCFMPLLAFLCLASQTLAYSLVRKGAGDRLYGQEHTSQQGLVSLTAGVGPR